MKLRRAWPAALICAGGRRVPQSTAKLNALNVFRELAYPNGGEGTHGRDATWAPMSDRSPVILIVDDEALLRMLAVDYFEENGYEVVEARDGNEAIAILKARPDIRAVFTDVQMPGRPDGFGVAREAREVIPDCAIVVVSARQWPESDSLARDVRFITKPYDGTTVVRMFDEMLGKAA